MYHQNNHHIFFFHIIQAPDTSLIKRIYTESLEQTNTFIKKIENLFNILGFSHVWENQGTFSISRLEKAMINKLKEKYVNFWKETRNENSCAYNKKLRTYNTFNGDYKLEDYLLLDIEKKKKYQHL